MIAVVGGGFGLYGHLASLLKMGRPVSTLTRYRPTLASRPELADLLLHVHFRDDENQLLEAADVAVLARRPADNQALVSRILGHGFGGRLVIEKPMAVDPDAALRLGAELASRNREWAVPYLFLYTDWFRSLRAQLESSGGEHAVDWCFRQSPQVGNWKRDAALGGGPLSFYFIHCIAMAVELFSGGSLTCTIRETTNRSRIELVAGCGRGTLRLSFTLSTEPNRFRVTSGDSVIFDHESPFGPSPARGAVDSRLPSLMAFYADAVFGPCTQSQEFHARVHGVWKAICSNQESVACAL